MAKIRLKDPSKVIAGLIRGIAATLHIRLFYSGTTPFPSDVPHVWTFWHNRMFLIPLVHELILPGQPAGILSSASGDGRIIADVCARFGLTAVRGSSSRRGAQALVELARQIKMGHDLGITPDGPRGPKYCVHPGVIKLAQMTGARIIPIHVRYRKAFHISSLGLRTWDDFQLPMPFSEVEIEFAEHYSLPRRMTDEECETERAKLEHLLRAGSCVS